MADNRDLFGNLPPADNPAEEAIRRIIAELVEIDTELISVTDRMASVAMSVPRRPKGLREKVMEELIERKAKLEALRDTHLKRIKHLQKGLPPPNRP